jgi:hypothetical protein
MSQRIWYDESGEVSDFHSFYELRVRFEKFREK